MALSYMNVQVELREISLKNRPKELYEASKKGTVPVLITVDGLVIDESLEIMIWSIKKSNMHELFDDNNNEKSKEIFNLIDTNDKVFKYIMTNHLTKLYKKLKNGNQEIELI